MEEKHKKVPFYIFSILRADRAKISLNQSIGILLNQIISSFNLLAFFGLLSDQLGWCQTKGPSCFATVYCQFSCLYIKSIGLLSDQLSWCQTAWPCLLPIQLSMYQIDCAIIRSVGLMWDRITILLCNCCQLNCVCINVSNRLGYRQISWVDVKSNKPWEWTSCFGQLSMIHCVLIPPRFQTKSQ